MSVYTCQHCGNEFDKPGLGSGPESPTNKNHVCCPKCGLTPKQKTSGQLTIREKALIAEVAQWISELSHFVQVENEQAFDKKLEELRDSWAILDSKPQEWGQIYDKCHRG